MYHIFIHSSVNRYLSYFHFFSIVTNAAMNTRVYESFWNMFFSEYMPRSEIAGSVQFRHSVVSDSLWRHGLQHARPPWPSPTPGVYLSSFPLSQWCHLTISSSVVPYSSCLQYFPASGGQSIAVSASASVLPMNIQDWSPLGWTGWISLQSMGLSGVFYNTTVQKHQFFGAQFSL